MKSIRDIFRAKNYYFPTKDNLEGKTPTNAAMNIATQQDTSPQAVRRNLTNFLTPVQLQRLKIDIAEWRRAVDEAEQAFYPHRVRMQRMYIDTVLNGHIWSAMDRRRDLTVLRGYKFVNSAGEELAEVKKMFKKFTWFSDFMGYAMDALFYGYTLISLGDIIDSVMKDVNIIRRWNVSPDRNVVSSIIYALDGVNWNDKEYKPWHIYVKTPTEHGVGKCGFGLLYKVALYEIVMRNVLGYNADFVELYAQPYRVGKTSKTSEAERAELEAALQAMGSNGYAVIDPNDEITFLETALGGTGWKGYENLEMRCQKFISKVILGHADALDSVPGKLGAGSGEDNPVAQALEDKQTKDGNFITPIINEELLPRLRDLGFKIPDDCLFELVNDDEAAEQREREDASNLVTAQVAQTMSTAGLQMSARYFQDRTQIETTEILKEEPGNDLEVEKDDKGKKPDRKKIKNMMNDLYAKH